MKKWMYLIFPGLLLAAFLSFYFPNLKLSAEREAARNESIARQKAADDAQKKALEDRAREDSERRAAETARDEAAKAAEAQAKWDAQGREIQAETDAENADIAKFTKQAADLQKKIDQLNKENDALTNEDFDLAKQVQLAEVSRSNADLEIQRMVAMISDHAAQSVLVRLPPTPPPAQ